MHTSQSLPPVAKRKSCTGLNARELTSLRWTSNFSAWSDPGEKGGPGKSKHRRQPPTLMLQSLHSNLSTTTQITRSLVEYEMFQTCSTQFDAFCPAAPARSVAVFSVYRLRTAVGRKRWLWLVRHNGVHRQRKQKNSTLIPQPEQKSRKPKCMALDCCTRVVP